MKYPPLTFKFEGGPKDGQEFKPLLVMMKNFDIAEMLERGTFMVNTSTEVEGKRVFVNCVYTVKLEGETYTAKFVEPHG